MASLKKQIQDNSRQESTRGPQKSESPQKCQDSRSPQKHQNLVFTKQYEGSGSPQKYQESMSPSFEDPCPGMISYLDMFYFEVHDFDVVLYTFHCHKMYLPINHS